MNDNLPLFRTILRLLTFRITADEARKLDLRFLAVGLIGTWLVGIGRHWDSPVASPLQMTGIGSVIYVLVLATVLYVIAIPFRPRGWSYQNVLTFLALTSFPAAIYAIPVERWVPVETAIQANIWFLALVASYRVALYLFWMKRSADLGALAALTAVFLPITVIITAISIGGYSGIVFDIMAGLRERTPTSEDGVNAILMTISLTSCISLPVLLVTYIVLIAQFRNPRARTPL